MVHNFDSYADTAPPNGTNDGTNPVMQWPSGSNERRGHFLLYSQEVCSNLFRRQNDFSGESCSTPIPDPLQSRHVPAQISVRRHR